MQLPAESGPEPRPQQGLVDHPVRPSPEDRIGQPMQDQQLPRPRDRLIDANRKTFGVHPVLRGENALLELFTLPAMAVRSLDRGLLRLALRTQD